MLSAILARYSGAATVACPYYKCDMQKHRDPEHLEPKKAPEGWFPDVRTQPA